MQVNYRRNSPGLYKAYTVYRQVAPEPDKLRVIDFAAGWNAALEYLRERSENEEVKENEDPAL